jgi:ABC-2 type transport system ATP-binding protein
LLRRAGATVHDAPDGDQPALRVAGLGSIAIGDLAAQHGIALYELTSHEASLEAAYMQLTHDQREFAASSEEHVQ